MLRYDRQLSPGLVALYTTPGQETDRVYSYNPGARTARACGQNFF